MYKLGKYQEALEILTKSWNLRKELGSYEHDTFIHLEEANNAVKGIVVAN